MPRSRKQVSQINVVPLIDVMLVLLVVFMVTAPFINPGQVDLPSVAQTSAPPSQPVEIILRESGEYQLRDRAAGGEARTLSRTELAREVRVLARQQPDRPFVIAADKGVRYEEVANTMTLLQRAEITRIGLLARPAP